MENAEQIHKIPFRGSSMDPIFEQASSVWIDFSKNQNLKIADVIVYQTEDKEFICHRIIGYKNNSFYLKGDNSLWAESLLPTKNWGRVVAFEKQGKKHQIRNHFLLHPYCWLQMLFQSTSSLMTRRVARKLGQIYLHSINFYM